MSEIVPSRFKYIGDWLISRSEALLAGFQMNVCINIIRTEAMRDNWFYRITDEDITRILARYKEHVSFWNAPVEAIRAELQEFSTAIGKDFYQVATEFDRIPPKRIPPEIKFTFALIQKYARTQLTQDPNVGQWFHDNFSQEEINRLQSYLYQLSASANLMSPNQCQIRGSFTRGDLEGVLSQFQIFESGIQNKEVRYEIKSLY